MVTEAFNGHRGILDLDMVGGGHAGDGWEIMDSSSLVATASFFLTLSSRIRSFLAFFLCCFYSFLSNLKFFESSRFLSFNFCIESIFNFACGPQLPK
jgi:hypothetical protein